MKILKFNTKQKFHYKRKVIIKNLLLNISVGIHDFEKNKKQKVTHKDERKAVSKMCENIIMDIKKYNKEQKDKTKGDNHVH